MNADSVAYQDDQLSLNIVSRPETRKERKAVRRKELHGGHKLSKKKDPADAVKVPSLNIPQKEANLVNRKRKAEDLENPGRKRQHVTSLFKNNPDIPCLPHCKEIKKENELLFTDKTFGDMELHPYLVSCLESRFGASTMTEVQYRAIPELLQGKDTLVKSCTGSGKTLAYAVPIVQTLQAIEPKIQRSDGTYAVVILPTRELALQSFECFLNLTKAFTRIVPGYLIGGEKKKSEKARIRKGINILVSTPGRLLDHLDHTSNLSLKKVRWLIIDEADKLLEQGFEESVLKIVSQVKNSINMSKLQTVLLSATLSRGVEKLAGMSLNNPVCIDIASLTCGYEEMKELVVPAQLKQFVVVTPMKLRLVTLAAFIVDKCSKEPMKALVFMCTQNCVDFHFTLFNFALKSMLKFKGFKAKFFKLHGNMKQEERTEVFAKFRAAETGILFCTDVAARGLDLHEVDWIIQYSAPTDAENYVHRVGRTARIGKQGHSLLFLIPTEVKFMDLLLTHKLHLKEIDVKDILSSLEVIADVIHETSKKPCQSKGVEKNATALQLKFENAVYSDESYHVSAKEAFLSFIHAYLAYPKSVRDVIPFKLLHLGHAAKSFCLRETPSELGCHVPKFASKKQRPGRDTREVKKHKRMVSEYDSGLNAWKAEIDSEAKRLKKKRHR